MTEEQIKKLDYCRKHISRIDGFIKDLNHNFQMYGCGQGQPNIEHNLEKIHKEMHENIINTYQKTKEKIQSIIDKI